MNSTATLPLESRPTVAQPLRRYWLTVTSATIAICLFVSPALSSLVEYGRGCSPVEPWRIFGCHFAHFDANHLFWSGSMFLVLASLLEPRGRCRLSLCVAFAAVAIVLAVHFGAQDLTTYRGLSGVDSALFTVLLVDWWREARALGNRKSALLYSLVGLSFLGKLAFEFITGDAVFAAAEGYRVVPIAHLSGALVGLGTGILSQLAVHEEER